MKSTTANRMDKVNHSYVEAKDGRYIAYCRNRDVSKEWLVLNLSPEQYYTICNEGIVKDTVKAQLFSFNGEKEVFSGKILIRSNTICSRGTYRNFYAICEDMHPHISDQSSIVDLGIKEFVFHNAFC